MVAVFPPGMLAKHRTVHRVETYRFSATRTISDYPLLIGEILFRSERARRRAQRKNILYEIKRIFGLTSAIKKQPSKSPQFVGEKEQEIGST
jgi:hypothetical protein